jgi:hypothetical protein
MILKKIILKIEKGGRLMWKNGKNKAKRIIWDIFSRIHIFVFLRNLGENMYKTRATILLFFYMF